MKLKIIMDSGKEYTIDSIENSAKGFYKSCFENGLPQSYTWNFMKEKF